MKFILEKGKNNTLNFLDLTIQKVKFQKKFNFNYSIYRKPTTSKLSIDYNSIHPNSHKWSNFHFLLNRLNNIPLSKNNYKKEFNIILDIAKYNNFPINKIQSLNNRIKTKLNNKKFTTLQNSKDNHEKKWVTLTYCGKVSDKISKIFNNNDVRVGFKNNNNVKKN